MKALKPTSMVLRFAAFILASATTSGVAKELRFPDFPATLENSVYGAVQGCLENDPRVLTAISRNEGISIIGGVRIMETQVEGVHSVTTLKGDKYGITLAFKGGETLCVGDKLYNMVVGKRLEHTALKHSVETRYTDKQCGFTPRYGAVCGAFDKVAGGLIKNGFAIDYQGVLGNGHIKTLLSGNEKSYYLTTDNTTGATVVTGVGKYEFTPIN